MLIVQADEFNESMIGTVVVAILTSNLSRSAAPGNLVLNRKQSGLPRNSVVNVSQIVTINKTFLTDKVTELPRRLMAAVDEGLRLVFSL